MRSLGKENANEYMGPPGTSSLLFLRMRVKTFSIQGTVDDASALVPPAIPCNALSGAICDDSFSANEVPQMYGQMYT